MRRILLILVLVTLGPLLIMQAVLEVGIWRMKHSTEVRANLSMARSLAKAFDQALLGCIHQQQTLAQAVVALNSQSPEKGSFLLRFATQTRDYMPAIHWVSMDGTIIASSHASAIGENLNDEAIFRSTIEQSDWIVSDLQQSNGTAWFAIFVPIRKDEEILGVTIAHIDPQKLGDRLFRLGPFEDYNLVLYDSSGGVVYCGRTPNPTWEQRHDIDNPMVDDALRGAESFGENMMFMSNDRGIVAVVPIQRIGWALEIGRPTDEVMAPLASSIRLTLIANGIAVIISVALAIIISRFITRGVTNLHVQAQALWRGEQQPQTPKKGIDELHKLAIALNQMAGDRNALEQQREQAMSQLHAVAEEAKQQAHDAQEGRDILNAMMENIPMGILIVQGDDANIRAFSKWGRSSMGFAGDVGGPAYDLLRGIKILKPDGDAALADEMPITRVMRENKVIREEEWAIVTDQRNIPVILTAAPIPSRNGQLGAVFVWQDISLLKQASDALQESEKDFRVLADFMPQIVFIADPQGHVYFTNKRFQEYSGLGLDKADKWLELVHPLDNKKTYEAWKSSTQNQTPFAIMLRLRARTGAYRWHLSRAEPFYDEHGRLVKYLGTATDVHDQKYAQEQLRQSEEKFRALAENANAVIIIVQNRKYVYINSFIEKISGFKPSEVLDMDLLGLVHPDSHQTVLEKSRSRGRLDARGDRYVIKGLTRDGGWRWMDLAVTPFEYMGRPAIIGTAFDITEQIEVREQLKTSEQRLRMFIEHAPAAIAVFDTQMRYIITSRRWLVDYRLKNKPIIGKTHYEVFPEIPDEWKEHHARCLAGEVLKRDEDSFVRADGTVDWLKWELRPWRTQQGEIGGIIIFTEVITQRKLQQEALKNTTRELARSNKDLEQFAYVASHDLQEPLRMVVAYMDLLQRRYGQTLAPEAKDFTNFAMQGARRMQSLVQGLLEYSRLGRSKPQRQMVDISELIEQVKVNLQQKIDETHAQVTNDKMPTIWAHPVQLEQVFQNLISNSIKFRSPSRPCKVHISTRQVDSVWQFSVADNGIGLDPAQAKRIFQIFQRLHSQSDYPGTGIGLSICKRIIDLHGGRIWVESAPDEGATFHFTIPYTVSPADEGEKTNPAT